MVVKTSKGHNADDGTIPGSICSWFEKTILRLVDMFYFSILCVDYRTVFLNRVGFIGHLK